MYVNLSSLTGDGGLGGLGEEISAQVAKSAKGTQSKAHSPVSLKHCDPSRSNTRRPRPEPDAAPTPGSVQTIDWMFSMALPETSMDESPETKTTASVAVPSIQTRDASRLPPNETNKTACSPKIC